MPEEQYQWKSRPDNGWDTLGRVLGALAGIPMSAIPSPRQREMRSLDEQQHIAELIARRKEQEMRVKDQGMQEKRFGWEEADRTKSAGLFNQNIAERYGEGAKLNEQGVFYDGPPTGSPPAAPQAPWRKPSYMPESNPPVDAMGMHRWQKQAGLTGGFEPPPQITPQDAGRGEQQLFSGRASPVTEQERVLATFKRLTAQGTDPMLAKQLLHIPMSPEEEAQLDERKTQSEIKRFESKRTAYRKALPDLSESQITELAAGRNLYSDKGEAATKLHPIDDKKLNRLYDQREILSKRLGGTLEDDSKINAEIVRVDGEIEVIESKYREAKPYAGPKFDSTPKPNDVLPQFLKGNKLVGTAKPANTTPSGPVAPEVTPWMGLPNFKTPDAQPAAAAPAAPAQSAQVKFQDDGEREAVTRYMASFAPGLSREEKRKRLEDFLAVYRQSKTASK